jgi:Ca-activated chloride channel family protein
MIFESPLWLFALLVLPVMVGIEAWLTRGDRERTARLVARPLWGRVLRRAAERWRWVRLALLLVGSAGVVLALARPQWGIVREKIEREGVDVVLVLDTSGSMATEDVPPNRFFEARQALAALVSRLEGDRFGLVAFEGEAYPLVPLTLDADAVGLFLETMEPGIVPSPGSSVGVGLAKGLQLFIDQDRSHKVMILVSDGEDLEGDVEDAVWQAKAAGVIVHAVGVGTEAGQPVPDFDRDGRRVGFKHDATGAVVVSRLNLNTLEAVARGTGGRVFRLTPADPTLAGLAAAIEGMEQKSLFREYAYRRKERFQIPLAIGLLALALAFMIPLPPLRALRWPWARARPAVSAAATVILVLALAVPGGAQAPAGGPSPPPAGSAPGTGGAPSPTPAPKRDAGRGAGVMDELLLRPRRLTASGRKAWQGGNHPQALRDFERAAASRPKDPRARFNVADGLYKNGKFDEAATLFRSLGENAKSPLAGPSQYNLGNTLFQRQDYRNAIQAYREALRLAPDDLDARRNLELALRALEQQKEQEKKNQQNQNQNQEQQQKDQGQDQKSQQAQGQKGQPQQEQPKTAEQREDQKYREETGMPKQRAMQLLDALQQNEKAEQKKLLQAQRAVRRGAKDW